MKYTREELQAFQEKASNMKQEDFQNLSDKEKDMLQYLQCPFCQIIDGLIPAEKLYEDDTCSIILDINPARPGHVLIIPNKHYQFGPMVPQEEMEHMGKVAKIASQVVLKEMNATGTTILIQNGGGAGQKASHFMIHIIPRNEDDKLPLVIEEKDTDPAELESLSNSLREYMNKKLGIETPQTKKQAEAPKQEAPKKQAEEKTEAPKQEVPEAQPQQTPKEQPKVPETTKFITSTEAKRYHAHNCPFAQNISEAKRIFVTREEAVKIKKEPCSCVSGEKIQPKAQEEKKGVSLDNIANLFK